jgi:hypothetical protein
VTKKAQRTENVTLLIVKFISVALHCVNSYVNFIAFDFYFIASSQIITFIDITLRFYPQDLCK